jgi:hypothetical protein
MVVLIQKTEDKTEALLWRTGASSRAAATTTDPSPSPATVPADR